MSRNLGQCSLRRKRRAGDPMATYDSLPIPLRRWLSNAALPWSPASVRRVWKKSMAKGLSKEEALNALNQAEAKALAKDRQSLMPGLNVQS